MPRFLLTIATAFLLTLSLAACDSGGSNDDGGNGGNQQPGTFSASVTGDLTLSLSGTAVSTGFGGTWGIVLSNSQSQTMGFTTTGTGRPGSGTYVIRRNELNNPVQVGEFFGSIAIETGVNWFVKSGTLTLTSSTPTSVAGTFMFTADKFVGDGEEVTITGSFNTTNTGG